MTNLSSSRTIDYLHRLRRFRKQ